MFNVYENTYAMGEKTPTIKVVASKPKKASAEAIAMKLNRKQDLVSKESMRFYYVRAQEK